MRILKTNPVLTIFNSYLVDSPQPSTISYLWNFGSLLGLSLVTQIITGILLAMHFAGTAELAFSSVEHFKELTVLNKRDYISSINENISKGWVFENLYNDVNIKFFPN